ncbi:hypothetical protein IKE71_02975 [Candidatus Saccharibacteria bacterium]|nr:hypothetical protein [Candidatus Saccharibacteria bacterium]
MKTSDYISLSFIAILVTVVAYFLVNSILGDPSKATVRFEYVDGISRELDLPSEEIFNAAAVNPTVEVYVGSCVDQDQDGILSDKEKRDCGLITNEEATTENNYSEENNGLSDDENNAINNENGYANGTSAQQREAVENDIQEYQQQQQQTNAANNADAAARQETVSGS